MSIVDLEYKNKIYQLRDDNLITKDFLKKSLEFKKIIDDFGLIKDIKDSFFIDLYKKNFVDILDFEILNDFNYAEDYIYDIEEKIQNLECSKYNNVLDYMLLKVTDLNQEFYGTIINFIFNLFSEIEENIKMIKKIKIIWKNKYKQNFPNFSEFQKSNEFEKLTQLLIKEKKSYRVDFDDPDKKFLFDFLIFTSKESDFFVNELLSENVNKFLFDNKKEIYKKNGNIMLESIKNKILSYN